MEKNDVEPGQPATPAPKAVILIMDDDNALRQSAAAFLRTSGFEVAEANRVGEALQILHHQAVDIVLCEVTLAENFAGRALMRWLRDNRPTIKRIVTADRDAPLAGADSYGLLLSKPYRLADLDHCVSRVLAQ